MAPVVLHFPRIKSSFVEKAIQEEATERMLGSLGKRKLEMERGHCAASFRK
jgi:hypothetical protein